LIKLHEHVRRKWPGLWRNGWILLQDNVPSYNALSVKQFLANKNVTVLAHLLSYACTCFVALLPLSKDQILLEGTHFVLAEEVKAKTVEVLSIHAGNIHTIALNSGNFLCSCV
jgi:hypothetical protein